MSLIDKTVLESLDKNPKNVAVKAMADEYKEILESIRTTVKDLVAIPESDERMEAARVLYADLKTRVNASIVRYSARLIDYCNHKDPEPKSIESLAKIGLKGSIKTEQFQSVIPANSSVPSEKPMPNSTPIFSGKKGESLDEWLFLINNAFVSSNIPNGKRLVMAVAFLRQGPLHTIKRFITEKKSWENFEAELTRLFGNRNSEDLIKDNLAQLKYSDFSCLEDYINKFLDYFQEIRIPDMDAIKYFKKGLPENYRMVIALSDIRTVHDAIERVRTMERESDNYMKTGEAKSNYVSKVIPQGKKWSGKNKPKQATVIKPNKSENVKTTADVTCYVCKQKGHYAPGCPQKKKNVKKMNLAVAENNNN